MTKRTIPKPNLTLILKNNTSKTLPVQIFLPGNPNDIANQPQTYHANLASVTTFSAQASIQWRTRGSVGPYTTSTVTLLQLNIQGLIDALNALNIGSFWQASTNIMDGASSENEFGFVTVGTQSSFNIDASATPLLASIIFLFTGPVSGYIDWGDGSATDPITGNGTYPHTYTVPGLYNIVFFMSDPTLCGKIAATNMALLSVGSLAAYTGLSVLILSGNKLTAIDISGNPLITTFIIDTNFIPTSDINASLIALDGFGLSGGVYISTGQTPAAPPTGAGAAAKTSLQGKGWTVLTD